MCVYCMTGDEFFRDSRPPIWPWPTTIPPYVPVPDPLPATDYHGWPIERLKELLDVLERIKKLEDELKLCPCQPSKADYLGLLKKRIEDLEKKES